MRGFKALEFLLGPCLLTRSGVEGDGSGVAATIREFERPAQAVPSRVVPRKVLGKGLFRGPVGIQ